MNKKSRVNINILTQCALFAAILCIFSPLTIPIGPIPITLGVFAVMLTGVVLGWKKGFLSVLVYLFIGMCGVPLFSGGKSGLTALVGPTGGYIWSYLFMVMIIGILSKKEWKNKVITMIIGVLACEVGVAVCYACGTLQFMGVAGYTFKQALSVCVIPFIPFDLLKAVCASVLGVSVRSILKKAGYLD
jgi:biotin transport system substrate-specific component